jgi:hypothetical protein
LHQLLVTLQVGVHHILARAQTLHFHFLERLGIGDGQPEGEKTERGEENPPRRQCAQPITRPREN